MAKVAPAFKVYSQAFSSKSACKRRSDDLTPSGKKVSIDCSGIERSETPLPRKLVITTTKEEETQSQYVARLTWNLTPQLDDTLFTFEPPEEAHKIVLREVTRCLIANREVQLRSRYRMIPINSTDTTEFDPGGLLGPGGSAGHRRR